MTLEGESVFPMGSADDDTTGVDDTLTIPATTCVTVGVNEAGATATGPEFSSGWVVVGVGDRVTAVGEVVALGRSVGVEVAVEVGRGVTVGVRLGVSGGTGVLVGTSSLIGGFVGGGPIGVLVGNCARTLA